MKKQIPSWVAALIVVAAAIIIGLIYFKADMGGSSRTAMIEDLINRTAATGGNINAAPVAPPGETQTTSATKKTE
ncbi:MAG: UBA domain-containing protein [Armatimonadota bacterium]